MGKLHMGLFLLLCSKMATCFKLTGQPNSHPLLQGEFQSLMASTRLSEQIKIALLPPQAGGTHLHCHLPGWSHQVISLVTPSTHFLSPTLLPHEEQSCKTKRYPWSTLCHWALLSFFIAVTTHFGHIKARQEASEAGALSGPGLHSPWLVIAGV